MNNYDELKVYSENDDKNIVVSVNKPKIEQDNGKKKNTFFSVIWSALKAENFKTVAVEPPKYKVPVPKYTIISFCLIVLLTAMIVLMKSFVDLLLLIPIALIFAVLAMPCLILVFFCEFNTRRNIRTLHIFSMFILGIFACITVNTVCNKILVKFIPINYINAFGVPIVWSLLLCFLVLLFCNILKVSKMPECFLIAVAFSVGYAVAQSLLTGFSNLFIVTQINITNGQGSYALPIIINETEDLERSFSQMIDSWFTYYIFKPLLYSCMAVSVGAVVSATLQAKATRKSSPKSIYFLIILNVIVYAVSVLETNFIYYNLILRTISLGTALLNMIMLINNCLEKECN